MTGSAFYATALATGTTHIDREDPHAGFRVLQVDQTGTEIVVVADEEADRTGERPGYGDVWSISLSRQRR